MRSTANAVRVPKNSRTHIFIRAETMCQQGDSPMVQAYCVKCRAKREMADPKKVKLKNGKPAMKGKCPKCGTTLFRIGAA